MATGFWQIVPQAIVILALVGLTVWGGVARRPAWGFLGMWIFLILAPDVEHNRHHPRCRSSTACTCRWRGLAALAVIGGWELWKFAWPRLVRYLWPERDIANSGWLRRLGWIVPLTARGAVLAAALGIATIVRNTDYQDPITIWQDTVNKRPLNYRALCNLGCYQIDGAPDERQAGAAGRRAGDAARSPWRSTLITANRRTTRARGFAARATVGGACNASSGGH